LSIKINYQHYSTSTVYYLLVKLGSIHHNKYFRSEKRIIIPKKLKKFFSNEKLFKFIKNFRLFSKKSRKNLKIFKFKSGNRLILAGLELEINQKNHFSTNFYRNFPRKRKKLMHPNAISRPNSALDQKTQKNKIW
jgi:hypothetical protein